MWITVRAVPRIQFPRIGQLAERTLKYARHVTSREARRWFFRDPLSRFVAYSTWLFETWNVTRLVRFSRLSIIRHVSHLTWAMRFCSHLTRTTTWEDPRKTAAAANVAAVAAAVESSKSNSLGPLPDGWEQARTAEGEIYFINHQSRTTSWFDPRIRKSSHIQIMQIFSD